MDKYENYETEDFLSDEFFISWVLDPQPAHLRFWDAWIADHPHHAPIVDKAKKILLSLSIKSIDTALTDREIADIAEYIGQKALASPAGIRSRQVRLYNKTWFRAAAVVLLFLSAAILVVRNYRTNDPGRNTPGMGVNESAGTVKQNDSVRFYNNTAEARLVRLSDGSLVILSPHSEVHYPAAFSGSARTVKLVGEAFFEVRSDPQQPFLVYSNKLVTKVLGTSFTVRAFANEAEFKVTVNTGKVMVYEQEQANPAASSVTLISNQQVIYKRQLSAFAKDTLTTPPMLSPKEATRLFTFNNAPVPEVIAALEEAYQVTIHYDRDKFAGMTITASLSRLPLDEKINVICKAINAHCTIEDGLISIE